MDATPRPLCLAHTAGLGRLAIGDDPPATGDDPSPDRWAYSDVTLRPVLDGLAGAVVAALPGTRCTAESQRQPELLSCYRTFDHGVGEQDEVTVTVTIRDRDDRFEVAGDIGGDATGKVYFEDGCRRVAATLVEATEAAVAIAGRLAGQVDRIVRLLQAARPLRR